MRAAIAGHLEPGTEIFTCAIVTVGVMNDKRGFSIPPYGKDGGNTNKS